MFDRTDDENKSTAMYARFRACSAVQVIASILFSAAVRSVLAGFRNTKAHVRSM